MKIKIVLLLTCIALLSANSACSDTGMAPATRADVSATSLSATSTAVYSQYPVDGIIFAGKVENPNTGEWTNDRLVLLFYKSNEIARTVTSTGEYNAEFLYTGRSGDRVDGGLGIADGLFVLRIPNTYELHVGNLGVPISESPFVQVYDEGIGGMWHSVGLAIWMNPIMEGETREFFIPSKNIRYILIVLPSPISQLPAEIQQPGSIALLDGNRLVAVDPNAPEPAPQSVFSNSQAQFEQVTENITEFSPAIFPLNNCGGGAEIKQEITQTYIHEILDESKTKFGIELPLTDWLKIVFEVEQHYGISDKQITTYSTTLTVPAGQNVEYTVIRKQTWESGVAIVNDGVEVSAPYRILKSETFEVVNSQQKSCP